MNCRAFRGGYRCEGGSSHLGRRGGWCIVVRWMLKPWLGRT